MTMVRATRPPPAPPLLIWQTLHQADELRAQRQAVTERLSRLRPNSHRAILARAELARLTMELLKIEQRVQQ